ncbi:DivIVA domain-containing protein [Natranaerobius thermophilus]|uniref:DivIVA family protein n=1 Tax=Natranaerobius thermophilus (strain ATCC BAA-1301 / DSM 18059 / JW/NM-WN-LF) TaxID=457570 RepID=B2A2I7_NATTJ|nr:DivIVA domain-containing protein [Natranaerobius thermophilus]ACB84902.1 DivIVA family protein [Natranaerobius thermophilus JW/NM-WN-LF]
MTLTPLDIHNKEFSRSFRGYNPDEVNEFLDRVVKDYESIIKKNIELKEEVEKLNNKIEHYQKMEETLHNAIVVAQETAEEVKENAQKEAELIKREAQSEANKQIEDAHNKVNKIQQEIEELKKQASAHKTRFKSMLETQLDLLESEEWKNLNANNQEDYQSEYHSQNAGTEQASDLTASYEEEEVENSQIDSQDTSHSN